MAYYFTRERNIPRVCPLNALRYRQSGLLYKWVKCYVIDENKQIATSENAQDDGGILTVERERESKKTSLRPTISNFPLGNLFSWPQIMISLKSSKEREKKERGKQYWHSKISYIDN